MQSRSEFPMPSAPIVPIRGSDFGFPVARIFCVGRNYAAHAREMGVDEREPPFFFTKFPDAITLSGAELPYPPATADFQYEGELVIAIGSDGADLTAKEAASLIFGYAAGLDMTRRDLQLDARSKGRPWDMGKNFPMSAPIAAITRSRDLKGIEAGELTLTVNGAVKQHTPLSHLVWDCTEIVAQLSHYLALSPGDLIFTGTPAGVGAVRAGDAIRVVITGLDLLDVTIGAPDLR